MGLLVSQPAVAACKVAKFAELPVTLVGRRAMIDAKFGQRDTRLIVDSGAFYSTLSRASAAEFGLKTEPAPAWFRLRGINGDSSASLTRTKDFSLAGIALPPVDFIVGGSDTGTAGLLGQNILALGDTEYDLPHGMVRLMRVEDCRSMALAYWANGKPFSTIPLERGNGGSWKPHIIGTVLVNGVKMRAIFDTGSPTTMMTLSAAKRAGITPQSPGVMPSGMTAGLGSHRIATWLATFSSIDLGGEVVSKPKFQFADIQFDGDMLIGFDFFLTHRMFVSNANHMLYMTYEGGPLFGLTPSGARTASGEKLDLSDKTAEPTDAESFSRRGAVFMSHGKFAEGLADFDKAVAMAPNEGRYVHLRAQARLANNQSSLAMADFDTAVSLLPTNYDVRLERARLRLANQDRVGAAEDLKAADAGLAPGSDRRLDLARMYEKLDELAPAIANYGAWLKLHAADAGREVAYNGRCWSRALLNRELDGALADCNMALKLRPGYGPYLDSRALVRFRRGELQDALDDYDRAIQVMPRSAWSLYARSLVQKRLGMTAKADEGRNAAISINPAVAQRATKYDIKE
jgi:tetratricopeptide (TPR) repeat protein/predicted aspartyl protease